MDWMTHPPGNILRQAANQIDTYLSGPSQLGGTMISHNLVQHQESQSFGRNNHLNALASHKIRGKMRTRIRASLTKQEMAGIWGPIRMLDMANNIEAIIFTEASSMEDYYLDNQKLKIRVEMLITPLLMATGGSSSNNGSNQGLSNTYTCSNHMNALSSGWGDSILEAVRPFYSGEIGTGTRFTTQRNPSCNGFSVGGFNGSLTHTGSSLELTNTSQLRDLDEQSLNSICIRTQLMQNYQQSLQQTLTCTQTQQMQNYQQSQQKNLHPHVQSQPLLNSSVQAHRTWSDNYKTLQPKIRGNQQFDFQSFKEEPIKQDGDVLKAIFQDESELARHHSDRSIKSQNSSSCFVLNGLLESPNTTDDFQENNIRKSPVPLEKCQAHCMKAKPFLMHLRECKVKDCLCGSHPEVLLHIRDCRTVGCSICGYASEIHIPDLASQSSGTQKHCYDAGAPTIDTLDDLSSLEKYSYLVKQNSGTRRSRTDAGSTTVNISDDTQNPRKYFKVESQSGTSRLVASSNDQPCSTQRLSIVNQKLEVFTPITPKIEEVKKKDLSRCPIEDHALFYGVINDREGDFPEVKLSGNSEGGKEMVTCSNQEELHVQTKFKHAETEIESETTAVAVDHGVDTRSGKQIVRGVTLTEVFTPEQIHEHIASLKQSVGQSRREEETNQAATHHVNGNSCQLCCAADTIYYEARPIYCALCPTCIKRNVNYYSTLDGDARYSICTVCIKKIKTSVKLDGLCIQKSKMEKKKNNEEHEEPWVQCDKCEGWQHQVCALFNDKKNDMENAEYVCPKCYVEEIKSGERTPLQHSDMLGAKDLPRTMLSDHIEQRLFIRLKQEREERANTMGKNFNEVPGAEDLVVRVVLSVDKKLQVKPKFLDAFQEENYPTEFPYRSKVILLFQKIEGVEVCLFAMYVQEYGSRCGYPNQRWVYLSYLDSVKYFRPEAKTVKGEALRTFVYHEILIGYLEYCKKRGFTSCCIWTCPPLKGDDFILYRHPEIQKTPKREKLREWYLAMLKKATNESIVVNVSNLYEHYFVGHGENKVTATQLPYFDGDYWPTAAEGMLNDIEQKDGGGNTQTKGKKTISRTLKARGYMDISENAAKDILLMDKLGKAIFPTKESIVVIQLQFSCTRCFQMILCGKRWFCKLCEKFHLCDKCHEAEQNLEERKRHPVNSKEKHVLSFVNVNDVPLDTEDNDKNYESELFDSRQTFLNLCQENYYQYDSLRRAKHSSMMILYHLQTQAAPSPSATCNLELQVKVTGETNGLKSKVLLDLVEHAFQCCNLRCSYLNCLRFKDTFKHLNVCKIHSRGGFCVTCKTLWRLLQRHARSCKKLECPEPRCKALKEYMRNQQQQQSDSCDKDAVVV